MDNVEENMTVDFDFLRRHSNISTVIDIFLRLMDGRFLPERVSIYLYKVRVSDKQINIHDDRETYNIYKWAVWKY